MKSVLDKPALRRRLLFARRSLPRRTRLRASRRIAERVIRLPEFRRARAVLAYWPADSEVDSWPILKEAVAQGKTVLLPKLIGRRIRPVAWRPGDPMQISRYGIPEPAGTQTRPARVDLAILPGLGFGPGGSRLGRGEGFYDRFLRKFRGVSCGVAFEVQRCRRLPTTARDVPIHLLVTEKRVYRFSKRRFPSR